MAYINLTYKNEKNKTKKLYEFKLYCQPHNLKQALRHPLI